MPNKCCVYNCKSGYLSTKEYVPMFRFPKDDEARQSWIRCLPNANFIYTDSKRICEKHWPPNYQTKTVSGGLRVPVCAPSVFFGIPKSCLGKPAPKPRKTRTVIAPQKNICANELNYSTLPQRIQKKFSDILLVVNNASSEINLLSHDRTGPVYKFSMFINYTEDHKFRFIAYAGCYLVDVPLANKGVIKYWTELQNAINFVINYDATWNIKNNFLIRQVELSSKPIRHSYSVDDIMFAMDLLSKSRTIYNDLLKVLVLPSIRQLQRFTSSVDKLSDVSFLNEIFGNLLEQQRRCVILLDEIYVKQGYQYGGGKVYGQAVNSDTEARTVLAVMITCLFGGPKFVMKIYPVAKLTASFQIEIIKSVKSAVQEAGGKPVAVIMDNNKVNQVSIISMSHELPFLCSTASHEEPFYLLNDTVHILKCIRNNWLTEKTQELEFRLPNEDITRVARWRHLLDLLSVDHALVKLSPLTEKAVRPKPIERQNVNLVLKVFCDKTATALDIKFGTETEDTTLFIKFIVKWWTVVNNRQKGLDERLKDLRRTAIASSDCWQISFLMNDVPQFASYLAPVNSKNRNKKLTADTSKALANTSMGLSSLACHLLHTDHNYVLLGMFQTDYLEKQFGKYRQCGGGKYLISVHDISQRFRIDKARKFFKSLAGKENTILLPSPEHLCEMCHFDHSLDIHSLPACESDISIECKQGLVYVAGYVLHKLPKLQTIDDTSEQMALYGSLIKEGSFGGLKEPGDSLVYFVYFCYIAFLLIIEHHKVCQKGFIKVFSDINANMKLIPCSLNKAACILVNIFLNNWTRKESCKYAGREELLKVAKLS